MREADIKNICNFRQLDDTIATGGQPTERQLAQLAQFGVEVVINLGLADAEYSLADEKRFVESLGQTYIHIPVVFGKPTGSDLDQFIDTMRRQHDRKLFVHCAQNKRVSAFIALYRILELGWSQDEAMAELYRVWQPNAVWRKFITAEIRRRTARPGVPRR